MAEKRPTTSRHKSAGLEIRGPTPATKLRHPLWDANLDSVQAFKRLKRAARLHWGILLRVLEPGWDPLEEARITGQDWHVWFFPPKGLKLPVISGPPARPKKRWKSFRYPVALLQVATDEQDLNSGRDRGASLVRSLVGLLQTRYDLIVASEPLWEGAIGISKKGRPGFMASRQEITVEGVTPDKLYRRGLELAPFRLAALPPHLASSLRWYGLAWSSPNDRTAQFMHFWLAALVLINHRTRGKQPERIRQYVGRMFLSPQRESELAGALLDSYRIRLEIVHECKDDSVTLASLERLQKAALELIEFEKGQFQAEARSSRR